ncbi:MAG: hypothetical protein JJT89_10430 [Nitriliruptoraceae bacterium]|nr:hypothetical protein [Nitriliruptoraceae bacterium]
MGAPADPDGPDPERDPLDVDRARARLEDALLALPYDRALPDLDELLAAAQVPPGLLQRDERVRKVLQEAIVARPFSDLDVVRRTSTELELLTLEVEVLADRLAGPTEPDQRTVVHARLAAVRARLDEIRRQL